MINDQHVVPLPDGSWGVRAEGRTLFASCHPTRDRALAAARESARRLGAKVVLDAPSSTATHALDPPPTPVSMLDERELLLLELLALACGSVVGFASLQLLRARCARSVAHRNCQLRAVG